MTRRSRSIQNLPLPSTIAAGCSPSRANVEALAAYRDALTIRKAQVEKDPSDIQSQNGSQTTIQAIGGLAYRLVLARDFARALEAADQAIALAPEKTWIHRNRAHALMFLGRADEARAIYLQNRGAQKVIGEKKLGRRSSSKTSPSCARGGSRIR